MEDSSGDDIREKEKSKKPYKSTARVTEVVIGGSQ